ncbi:MAG TPA: phosphate ABC transporter permease subunit PstC [Candidatus Hydrogenedentes bacterium]|nr:phosphate ABC transporter permease subunit PstC [Candidatus Hydrogenedentota bacterium]HOV60813.1 phosphate ABC transporter permease subunit PstC [Candidatus Hydrogenedentota bacterium]
MNSKNTLEMPLSPESRVRGQAARRARRVVEALIVTVLGTSTGITLLVTAAILLVLGVETVQFFRQEEVTLREFFFSLRWNPLLGGEKHFGIWPLLTGTLLISVIGLAVAVPMGLVTAIYLSEYAHPRVRAVLKPALELLAGIPTVVYGFFALAFITPLLKWLHEGFNSYNALSAGIAVGILIVPIVSSIAEDAMRAVPNALREGVYGLGGTRFDAAVKVVFPAALSGIVAAVLLAMARAVGETMVVALAAGSTPRLAYDPRLETQTMTGFMVQMAMGDVSNFGVEYYSLYAVAATLFLMTFSLTLLGAWVRRRYQEKYE